MPGSGGGKLTIIERVPRTAAGGRGVTGGNAFARLAFHWQLTVAQIVSPSG